MAAAAARVVTPQRPLCERLSRVRKSFTCIARSTDDGPGVLLYIGHNSSVIVSGTGGLLLGAIVIVAAVAVAQDGRGGQQNNENTLVASGRGAVYLQRLCQCLKALQVRAAARQIVGSQVEVRQRLHTNRERRERERESR